jgi:hypothetical protein
MRRLVRSMEHSVCEQLAQRGTATAAVRAEVIEGRSGLARLPSVDALLVTAHGRGDFFCRDFCGAPSSTQATAEIRYAHQRQAIQPLMYRQVVSAC